MSKEVELRAKINNLRKIKDRLDESDLKATEKRLIKDCAFDNPKGEFYEKGIMIRLRSIEDDKHLFAYKGPSEMKEYKVREEIELEISDPEKLKKILEQVGLQVTFEMEKMRKTYRGDGCTVELEEYPVLGSFMEIEGDPADIEKMIDKLGMERDKFNSRSLDYYINKKEKEVGEKIELKFKKRDNKK